LDCQRIAHNTTNRRYGAEIAQITKPWGQVFTLDEIRAAMAEHKPAMLGVVHAETSTGACQPMEGRPWNVLIGYSTNSPAAGSRLFWGLCSAHWLPKRSPAKFANGSFAGHRLGSDCHWFTPVASCAGIAELCREYNCLFLLDTVTSIGGLPVFLDKWGVDACYAGGQKCLSCPPGIAPLTFRYGGMANGQWRAGEMPVPRYFDA
jgi:hypothetical protein